MARSLQPDDLIYGDPLTWWLQVGQARYPTLFKIALTYLSHPPPVNVKGASARPGERSLSTGTPYLLQQSKRFNYSVTGSYTGPSAQSLIPWPITSIGA